MQQEQQVTNLRTNKLSGPGPVRRKPVRNSISLSSPGNESPSSGPAGNVQSPPESPVPKVPTEPPIDVVYEDIGEIFRKNDSRCPNDNIPTYENLPMNLPPSNTDSITDVDSEDRTYVNQEHLRMAAEELADVSSKKKCKSSANSVTSEVPRHGTYVKIRSQISVQSDSSDAKEELDVVENDESGEIEECYEVMGNIDRFLKSAKSIIPSEPIVPTERDPETAAANSLQSRRPSETQQEDCEIKLPTVKQTSKDKLNIKTAISGFKNSLMKEIRGAAHRNPPGADGAATKWTSVSQIPANVDQFTIDQVSQCLRLLNLGRYVAPFKERKMNGTFLAKASEEMLMQHFQMDALEAQQLVMFAQQGWRPK